MPIDRLPESVHTLYAEVLRLDRPADVTRAWRQLERGRRRAVLKAAERLEPEVREGLAGLGG